jgi:signal transduction histidine kinase
MSILNTPPTTDQLRADSHSNTSGVARASNVNSKTRPSPTLQRQIGHEETLRGSSTRKLTLIEEDNCVRPEKDLSHDLRVRESATILGQVCHDIRQPVVALLACVELLTESMGTAMTEEQKELIASMQASSRCMLELVDDSLALAFAAAGTLDFDPALVVAIAEQSVAGNRPLADRRQSHSELQRKR